MTDLLPAGGADICHDIHLPLPPFRELIHDLLEQPGAEEFPEDLLLFVGIRPQKLHEFSLGDHCHLHELTFRQSCDLLQLPVRLLLGILGAVRHGQGDRFADRLVPRVFPLRRAHVPRHTPYPVLLLCSPASLRKYQLNVRLQPRDCVLALKLRTGLFVRRGTGLSVQREHNGVKERRLSRSGVPGDQEQILGGLRKIDIGPPAVGAESLHGKPDRSHSCTSCTRLMTSFSSTFSSSSRSFRKAQHSSKGSSAASSVYSAV